MWMFKAHLKNGLQGGVSYSNVTFQVSSSRSSTGAPRNPLEMTSTACTSWVGIWATSGLTSIVDLR